MRPSHILWDFNGTVLDDVAPCISSINELLTTHGLKPLKDRSEYQSVFGFPVKDYYERIGFDFMKTSFEVLAVEWVNLYYKYNTPLMLCPRIVEALEAVKEAKIPQLILTASKTEMVQGQLDELGIGSYFDGIIGLDNIHASGKSDIALEWKNKVKPTHAVMIGDTEHDAEVADLIGAECLLVCCGHMSKQRLEKVKPVFEDPYEAAREILKNKKFR